MRQRCFQPSWLCFAMVSEFVLLSWLLMMRLVPCRSEPSSPGELGLRVGGKGVGKKQDCGIHVGSK